MLPSNGKSVLIIAGETSGDTHGAELVRAMKKLETSVSFCGIGGDGLKKEGVHILFDAAEISVLGFTEVFAKVPAALKAHSTVKNILCNSRPDLVILIDFPEFNLPIAKIAKQNGIPVLYYISPQIWAWRSGRIHRIKRDVDHVAVILPFEKEFYAAHAVPATFVGHPLLDYYPHSPLTKAPEDIRRPVVGLLPGSRLSEIERNLPGMLAAASQLQQQFKEMSFLVSLAPWISREWMETNIAPYKQTCNIALFQGDISGILGECTLVIAASGTVTLEAAIHEVPMIIVYRVSPVSYMLGRALIHVDHIGLVNIIANERIVPELIQNDASPSKIAQTVSHLVRSPDELRRIREKLRMVHQRLGNPGAAEKTAEIAFFLLNQHEFKDAIKSESLS